LRLYNKRLTFFDRWRVAARVGGLAQRGVEWEGRKSLILCYSIIHRSALTPAGEGACGRLGGLVSAEGKSQIQNSKF